ncbi:MAG: hypothetical protein HOL51_14480 [Gemmatimonadetes bacterium]|jgi:hypothetical protein|nr:hypothetical protein [Gemmatimonadota bacterium]MBT5724701.1 hypothetical protein [Gammaproteobacteria bacterium]
MHVVEVIMRVKDGDIQRTLEWWKGLVQKNGAYSKNGQALSRMDGENSILIVRHTFSDLGEEGIFWDTWNGSDAAEHAGLSSSEYVDGPPSFHRYAVLHSY